MFDNNHIRYVDLHLLTGQVDLILEALELYAFNLHKVWAVSRDNELEELRNALLFHTYEGILDKYNTSSYRIGYDVMKECDLQIVRNKKGKYEKIKKFPKMA